MLRLVTIDLAGADVALFEAYEARVLPLLVKYGGRLEMRVRALDGSREVHLLFFPDAQAYEDYRSDPVRLAAQGEWAHCGATSDVVEVARVQT